MTDPRCAICGQAKSVHNAAHAYAEAVSRREPDPRRMSNRELWLEASACRRLFDRCVRSWNDDEANTIEPRLIALREELEARLMAAIGVTGEQLCEVLG